MSYRMCVKTRKEAVLKLYLSRFLFDCDHASSHDHCTAGLASLLTRKTFTFVNTFTKSMEKNADYGFL